MPTPTALSPCRYSPAVMERFSLYEGLWQARQRGVEPLTSTLRESLVSFPPASRRDVLEELKNPKFGFIISNVFRDSYRTIIPYPSQLREINERAHELEGLARFLGFRMFPAGGIIGIIFLFVGGYQNAWVLSMPFSLFATGSLFGANYIGRKMIPRLHAMEVVECHNWLCADPSDLPVHLFAASFASEREEEIGHLALAAGEVYNIGVKKNETFKPRSDILVETAMLRGSHHAAHVLWLLHQEGLCTDTTLQEWTYDPHRAKEAFAGDPLSEEIVNLAVRESPGFRHAFLRDVQKSGLPDNHTPSIVVARQIEG